MFDVSQTEGEPLPSIDKNENRDKGICKPRTSVRKQLSETKQAASPKRAAARSKQHEMEV